MLYCPNQIINGIQNIGKNLVEIIRLCSRHSRNVEYFQKNQQLACRNFLDHIRVNRIISLVPLTDLSDL